MDHLNSNSRDVFSNIDSQWVAKSVCKHDTLGWHKELINFSPGFLGYSIPFSFVVDGSFLFSIILRTLKITTSSPSVLVNYLHCLQCKSCWEALHPGESSGTGIKKFNELLQTGVWHITHLYFIKLSETIQVILVINNVIFNGSVVKICVYIRKRYVEKNYSNSFLMFQMSSVFCSNQLKNNRTIETLQK